MGALDISGQRYGRLVAVARRPSRPGETIWLWRCDCGVEKEIALRNIRQGKTRSCGCLHAERLRTATRTHGHTTRRTPSRTMRSYWSMKQRCYNPKAINYANYGGRGIGVCEEWRLSFEAFLSDMGERPPGTTLDRIDPDRDYDPQNTRWATSVQQGRGRRDTLKVDAAGRSLRAYARLHKLDYPTLQYHYRTAGKPFEEAVKATKEISPLSRRRSARRDRSKPDAEGAVRS